MYTELAKRECLAWSLLPNCLPGLTAVVKNKQNCFCPHTTDEVAKVSPRPCSLLTDKVVGKTYKHDTYSLRSVYIFVIALDKHRCFTLPVPGDPAARTLWEVCWSRTTCACTTRVAPRASRSSRQRPRRALQRAERAARPSLARRGKGKGCTARETWQRGRPGVRTTLTLASFGWQLDSQWRCRNKQELAVAPTTSCILD